MKLTMLGTGHAMVTECYNTCLILEERGEYFLVDGGGGNGILRQLKRAGIAPEAIQDLFVTHKHLDHLTGALWMIRSACQAMNQGRHPGELRLYSHPEVLGILETVAPMVLPESQARFLGNRVFLIPVGHEAERQILGRRVLFFDIGSHKARQFGFTLDLGEGMRLTHCGDEPCREWEKKYAAGSKWLIHEAFCLASQADLFHPYEKSHSTVADACRLAQELQVQNLILCHTEDTDLPHRRQRYTEEGSRYYHGNLHVPEDLESFLL